MTVRFRRLMTGWAVASATGLLLIACGAGHGTRSGNPAGMHITVMGAWSGVEEQRFELVLQGFEQESGFRVRYTPASNGVPAALAVDRAAGRLPDVAFLPQPGLLQQYAHAGLLVPIGGLVGAEVRRDYSSVWQQLGSADGRLYGVWFKAADKSLIWYNIGVFERTGVVPPGNLGALLSLAGHLRKSGLAPFAVGAADGWTLTDWFENLYLTTEGPQRYDLLARHRIPWTDASVKQTLRLFGQVLEPDSLAGGVTGALRTRFDQSVADAFAHPPRAAMVYEGDFVAGVISGSTTAQLGVDADVFPFPTGQAGPGGVEVGGDVAVLMSHSAAAAALIRYLATPRAGSIWAAKGGFVSPNLSVDPGVYPDPISRAIALNVLDAGDSIRFDLSDLQPARFGATPGQGMFAELQRYLVQRDVDATAARLEAEASAAYRA